MEKNLKKDDNELRVSRLTNGMNEKYSEFQESFFVSSVPLRRILFFVFVIL